MSGERREAATDALDALMRAMVQLPTYLERVLAGGRDLALVLLPLLNDLRAVRGSPLLSEGTLLLLNLKSDQPAQPQRRPGRGAADRRALGAAAAAALSGGLLGLDSRRAHRPEPGDPGARGGEARAGRHHPAGVPTLVGGGAVLEAMREHGLEAASP